MQLRLGVQNRTDVVSSPQGRPSASPSARCLGRQAVVTARDRSSHLKSLPATDQHKQRCTTRSTLSLSGQLTRARTVQCQKLCQLTVGEMSQYHLNREHNRLIVQDLKTDKTHIWLSDRNGSFEHSFSYDLSVLLDCTGQHDPNILFVPLRGAAASTGLMCVYERDAAGEWARTQTLTADDLADPTVGRVLDPHWHYPARTVQSNDSSSVVCLTAGKYGTILGRGPDGLWTNRGRCMQYHSAAFSADSNHIALGRTGKLSLMSKSADGWWSKTGGADLCSGELQLQFSPDSRHFVAWFERTGQPEEERYYATYGVFEFFVMLFSLDDQGQWREKQRITRHLPNRQAQYPLKVEFSPDGKHLAVCAKHDFDLLTLNADSSWTPALENIPYHQEHKISGKYSVINFAADSTVLMVVTNKSAAVWALQDDGQWQRQHTFCHQRSFFYPQISPDAKTIVCATEPDKRGLWRQRDGCWAWQDIAGSIKQPRFNCDGSLLAFIDESENALVLMAPARNGYWRKKKSVTFKGTLRQFTFDPSGRTVQVVCKEGDNLMVSFWGLDVDESLTRVRRKNLR